MATYIEEVLADSPWSFNTMQDAGIPLLDSSGNGRALDAVNGSPDFQQPGLIGNDFSVGFDNSEFVSNDGTAPNITDNFTLECFFYMVGSGGVEAWIWQCGLTGGTGWSIAIDSSNQVYPLANNVAVLTKGPVLSQNIWYHLAIKRNTIWTLYVDGVPVVPDAGNTAPGPPGDLNRIAGPIIRNLPMRLAYCAVYDTALSDARILAHFEAASAGSLVETLVPRGILRNMGA